MKTFNQVVTVIVLLLLLVILPVIATIPDAVVQTVRDVALSIEPWVATSTGRVVTGVVAVLLWLLTIWLLWREFRRPADGEVRVAGVEGGRAEVSSASVAKLLEQRVSAIPTVRRVTAKVRQSREGVVADLVLATCDGVTIPEVTQAAIAKAREVLEKEVGARVADVEVRVRELGMGEAIPEMAPPPSATRPEEEAPQPPVVGEPTYPMAPETPARPPEEVETRPLVPEAPEEEYRPLEVSEAPEEPGEYCPPEVSEEPQGEEELPLGEGKDTEVLYTEPPEAPGVDETPEEPQDWGLEDEE